MNKRGRPPLKRAPGDQITQGGLTVEQRKFLRRGWERRGFASAAHWLRYIVDRYRERVEAGQEEDRFTPAGLREVQKEVDESKKRRS